MKNLSYTDYQKEKLSEQLTVKMTPTMIKIISQYAYENNTTSGEIVRYLITLGLEKDENK